TMLNVCKVPLNACGVDASSKEKAEQSNIWDFVVARLASMRADSCTAEVKDCLQSDDRCGKDYTKCIGLDTDTIIRMCPYDKLTGCQKVYGEDNVRGDDVYDQLANMVQGIMLNIDNNFLTECQNAANEAMIKVCGDTENCNGLTVDDGIGARSLEYKICEYNENGFTNNCKMTVEQIQDSELGRHSEDAAVATSVGSNRISGTQWRDFATKIDGEIPWDAISFIDENGNLRDKAVVTIDGFKLTSKAENELLVLRNSINIAIEAIEADPKVQFCMTGREVQGMAKAGRGRNKESDVDSIGEGGKARFPGLTGQMRSIIASAALQKARDNYYKEYDDLQKRSAQDYVAIATRVAEVKNENALDYRREAARQACVNYAQSSVLGTVKVSTPVPTSPDGLLLVGSGTHEEKNYKETITTTFNWEGLVCKRCVRSQKCAKMKKNKYCKYWGENVEKCEDVQF
ncbi:MAG: hypothetical protein IJY99_01875, partial [Alphaproteobacteria bacterium]|nr:hypothetical protein [Alphaproteobacteria bacterium]